ncbi:MAG TPA: replication protein [Candidatus Paceibacterota bacterium]|nr:replication protein [Candidatus Paceibacterota bacterium]
MKGYTRFPHELLEAIISGGFSAREMKVLLVIVRTSYGFHHRYANLRNLDFRMAKLWPSGIALALRKLYIKKVIDVRIEGKERLIGINDPAGWRGYQNSTADSEKITKMVTSALSKQFKAKTVSVMPPRERPRQSSTGFQPAFPPNIISKNISLKNNDFSEVLETLEEIKKMRL